MSSSQYLLWLYIIKWNNWNIWRNIARIANAVQCYCQVTTIVSSSNWRYKYCLARKSLVVNWGLWQQQCRTSAQQPSHCRQQQGRNAKEKIIIRELRFDRRWGGGWGWLCPSMAWLSAAGGSCYFWRKKSINANRKERKCLTRFLANFLDKEWNFKERSWGSFTCGQLVTGQVPREWSGQEHAGRCLGERGFSNPNTKIQTQHKHVRKTNLCEKK